MSISPVVLRSNFGQLYGVNMLPMLEELFMGEMENCPSVRDRIFKTVSWDRDIYQTSSLGDMPLFNRVAEGTEYAFKRPRQGYPKTYTVEKFGLGFTISRETIDDGKFDLVGDMVRKLARSGRESQEIAGMSILNNGFSTELAEDGLSVFNAAHLNAGGANSFRNVPLAMSDLSETSLQTALADFQTIFYGDTGIISCRRPKFLVVHPSNYRYAIELTQSTNKADTADNNINSIRIVDDLTVISSPHLSDPDAWFLLGDPSETGLRIIERAPLATSSDASPGFTSDTLTYKASYREALGVSSAVGIYGNSGA